MTLEVVTRKIQRIAVETSNLELGHTPHSMVDTPIVGYTSKEVCNPKGYDGVTLQLRVERQENTGREAKWQ